MLPRRTPLRAKPETTKAWKDRTRKCLPCSSTRRAKETRQYLADRPAFLAAHPLCPVTGDKTTQIHHSAKREGGWLNLKRYWIAVSAEGHQQIEDHKEWAETVGLMVRINESCKAHVSFLMSMGIDPDEPIFYPQD